MKSSRRILPWLTLAVLAVGLPGLSETPEGVPHIDRQKTASEAEANRARTARLRWEYELRRSAAHARMPNTLYASTPGPSARGALSCPVVPGPAEDFRPFAPRVFRPASSPAPSSTAARRPFFVPAPARSGSRAGPARVAGTTATSPSSSARALAAHAGAGAFAAGAAADDRAAGTAAPGLIRASAIGDFNGDGKDDVLLRRGDGGWRLYAMDGRTHIAAESGVADIDADPAWVFAGAGDFNGDGKDDVLLRHADGRWRYYAMDGRRRIAGESGEAKLTTNAAWRVAGVGDFDGDGKDDVMLRHDDLRWYYYPMDGRRIRDGRGIANLTRNPGYSLAGIGDLDGDGSDDMLLRRDDGLWYYYPMDGRRHISGRQGTAALTRKAEYAVAGVGDFDGDGKDDALLRRDDGLWYYYPMDGREILDGRGVSNLTRNTEWSVAGIGDLDGDGKDDVLLRKKDTTGTWYYYPMDGGLRHAAAGKGGANLTSDRSWKPAGDAAPVFKDCAACPQMIEVPGGAFAMGSAATEAGRAEDEGPAREVTLAEAFTIGVREVTYAEWEACAADGGCGGHVPSDWSWGGGVQPVMDVTWEQARSYAEWLSAKTGEEYRLPTEAEWEYAARAGTATPFSTGATISTEQANYDGALPPYGAGEAGESRARTTAAGTFPANAFGLRDMHGNVAEWTLDCYAPSYGAAPTDGAAVESENCPERAVRGGSWRDGPEELRSANRDRRGAGAYSNALGFRVARGAPPGGSTAETAAEVFEASVSPVVQSKCVNCHVAGGVSGNTRLVFVRDTDADHLATNLSVFETFLAEVEGGADLILNKIQGVGHGGGVQAAAGTEDYAAMERFLNVLGEETGPVAITPETLFEGVRMEPWRSTLRRAAVVFAGRVPTAEEYESLAGATGTEFREVIRGLMQGLGFREFLLRASNDRLLTDRDVGNHILGLDYFVDYANRLYDLNVAAAATGNQGEAQEALVQFERGVQYGAARAPLELIVHVAESDLPYTEVLTADYIMANPVTAVAYGADTEFDDSLNVHEFRPSRIVSYYRRDESQVQLDDEFGQRFIDPGDLSTHYPHAGILNTTVFLLRYPTTATNRNRARSRWTYYHFLGLDIEKSASRTTDPVALADTNNPTMHNPACTVCHTVMDPVAGAFQNYGDEGWYRDKWGGMDSLDEFYKDDWLAAGETFEIAKTSRSDPQTISLRAHLLAGEQVLKIHSYFDPPRPDDSEIWWHIGVEHVVIRDGSGAVVRHLELQDLVERNRGDREPHEFDLCGDVDQPADYYVPYFCDQRVVFDVPTDGDYTVEAVVWEDSARDDDVTRERLVDLSVGGHVDGDTWYRDMRKPGFDGESVPDADSSLQWLAERIVADGRFAETTVKFWWPSLMGREVAEPPDEQSDADFEGRLLASNAQAAEVKRLARGFRRGFGGGSPYNLKDLLVEMVLSPWFRAQGLSDDDGVRSTALLGAGARRLLTPEELARKTLAVTGFQWGRVHVGSQPWRSPKRQRWSALADTEDGYGLLYGGIDSDGVTERATDLTSVMAGVAQSHAMESSCPIVMRELYLLPEEDRLLFGGIDMSVSPVFEFGGTFDVEAASRSELETLSISGPLRAGNVTVRLDFTNDFYDEAIGDRNVLVDKLTVRRTDDGVAVYAFEFEEGSYDCGGPGGDHWNIWSQCGIEASLDIAQDGDYEVQVVAWADQAGDELPKLEIAVNSDTERSSGARSIKEKLAELYERLHGMEVTADSPEVAGAYDLFVDVWQRRRESEDTEFFGRNEGIDCDWHSDQYYLEGIVEDAFVYREDWGDEHGARYDWDQDRIDAHFETVDWSDTHGVTESWAVVLAYLLMDYRYLYL